MDSKITPEDISRTDLAQLLDSEARRINSPAFIADDPVQFPRRYERLQDIEIASLLAATIAWGNRKMICRDADRMFSLMDNRPYDYVVSGAFEELPDRLNIHRTFFARNLKNYLRGLKTIYSAHVSLADFARQRRVGEAEHPSWALVAALNEELLRANGVPDSRCLPLNLKTTALKRVNMALRWLVRDDGIVDIGVWKGVIKPSQLYIPLDVHVGDVARRLGLLQRRSDDRRAVMELTGELRRFNPDDPVIYDFALFGIGMGL